MLVHDGEKPVNALTFTPDSKQLLAVCYGKPLAMWSVSDGKELPSPVPAQKANGDLFVHPSGSVVYMTEPKLTAVSLKSQLAITRPNFGAVDSIHFSRDGRFAIIQPSSPKGRLRGFRCNAKGTLAPKPDWVAKPHDEYDRLGGFIGDGEHFVTIDRGTIVTRYTATGEVRSMKRYPSYYASNLTTSPDGKWFAVGGWNKLYLYNTEIWGKPVRLNGTTDAFTPFAFHPTRQLLMAIWGGSTLAKFIDPETGALITKFKWSIGALRCVAFSPDGTLAAVGSDSGKIVVWDVDE